MIWKKKDFGNKPINKPENCQCFRLAAVQPPVPMIKNDLDLNERCHKVSFDAFKQS